MIVNVYEAKTHLSRLLRRVKSGEQIVIAEAGKPVARLVPLEQPVGPRVLGSAKGTVWIADDFDAPLPEDVTNLFYGVEVAPRPRRVARKRRS